MMYERILLWSLSSLLWQLRTVSYSVSCWVNIFSLANYILLTSLHEYFFDNNFQSLNLAFVVVLFMQFLSMTIS